VGESPARTGRAYARPVFCVQAFTKPTVGKWYIYLVHLSGSACQASRHLLLYFSTIMNIQEQIQLWNQVIVRVLDVRIKRLEHGDELYHIFTGRSDLGQAASDWTENDSWYRDPIAVDGQIQNLASWIVQVAKR